MDPALERAKTAAARRAVEDVRPGERLALGTGSTAAEAVRALAARFPGVSFDCVASSTATEELARSLGIVVRGLRADDRFDRMIDGADEVDDELNLTKGGGGALLREKLLAEHSAEVIILVDPTKLVRHLGERAPIPVEVVPFARASLERAIARDGFSVHARRRDDGRPYLTDNGNEILDLVPATPLHDPVKTLTSLRARTGVVEVGLFLGLADRVLIGFPDGHVEERRRRPGPTAH
ncbi:MAG: ribose-5-phosphate isomerase RpiA [Thermoplasmata archaeon]|nr:ribose-5-phosphate isomerase RpiA [Thermoplasmata archaeon]